MNTSTTPSRLSQSYPRDLKVEPIADLQNMAAQFEAANGHYPNLVRIACTTQEALTIRQEMGIVPILTGSAFKDVVMIYDSEVE